MTRLFYILSNWGISFKMPENVLTISRNLTEKESKVFRKECKDLAFYYRKKGNKFVFLNL